MTVFNLLNAAFGSQPVRAISSVSGSDKSAINQAVAPQSGQRTNPYNNGNQQSFGIKGREPLTQDLFEYKGEKLSKDDAKKKSYADVYRHESAHLSKAGKYATSGIVIDYDGNGMAKSGHVNIAMPKLNRENPQETIKHAEAVIASAEAPASFDELSDADKNVAAQARSVKAQALNIMA